MSHVLPTNAASEADPLNHRNTEDADGTDRRARTLNIPRVHPRSFLTATPDHVARVTNERGQRSGSKRKLQHSQPRGSLDVDGLNARPFPSGGLPRVARAHV